MDGVNSNDLIQGELGNCWLVAACCCLSVHKFLWSKVGTSVLHGSYFLVPFPPAPATVFPAPVPFPQPLLPFPSRSRKCQSRSRPGPANEDKDYKCKSKEVTHKIVMTRLFIFDGSISIGIHIFTSCIIFCA